MDAAEKSPVEKTEVKEKTSGRRRSTSRRKSNTKDPDPSPESPDPSPAPSPEPGAKLSPEAQPRASNPGHDPPDSPPRSPSFRSDLLSPAPMETEEEGVAMDVSPAHSPCSSSPETPCLRLEDEDSLSPLFCSDDSDSSPTASLGHTKKRLKQCAFCHRGEEPPLGQGPLVVFGPTPGYIPLHVLNRRASSDRDNDCHDHCYRGGQATPTCSSPEQSESSSEFMEQLGPVGLPCDIDVQSLFDPTGQCCAHLQCAAWSDGVCRGEGQCLLYVDKAIDSGSTQVCAFCRRLGASLRCREVGCGRIYHFPCAAAASANQEWSQRVTLCSRHAHKMSLLCVVCSSGGNVDDEGGGMLMCCCCGDHYHGNCLDPPLNPSSLCRAGWQCPQCRVCRSCGLREDGTSLLVCERCDKAYHPHCLSPTPDEPPSVGWSCKNCRVCRRCGVRSSGQWANHPFLCESCDPALPCILCGDAPDLYSPQDYVTCICCYRSVHTECIVQAGEARAGAEGYTCSTCWSRADEPRPHTPQSPVVTPTFTEAPPISPLSVSDRTEAPPLSPSAHSSVQFISSESPQSPVNGDCTQSQPSPHPPTDLRQSPAPSQANTTELPQSPCHAIPTEGHQNPFPIESEPSEVQQSSPSFEPSDVLLSPSPSQLEPSNLQETTLLSQAHPVISQESHLFEPDSANPQEHVSLSESHSLCSQESPSQESPSSPRHDPSEIQESFQSLHPESTDLPQSPGLSQPYPADLPESSEPSQPDSMEVEQNLSQSNPSPMLSNKDPTEPLQSLEQSISEPTETPQSQLPCLADSTELPQSPASLELHTTEQKPSLEPSHAERENPSPIQQGPSEVLESPASPISSSPQKDTQENVESLQLDSTKLQESHVQSYLDSNEVQEKAVEDLSEEMEQESTVPSSPRLVETYQNPIHERQEDPPHLSSVEETPMEVDEDADESLTLNLPQSTDSAESTIHGQSDPQSPLYLPPQHPAEDISQPQSPAVDETTLTQTESVPSPASHTQPLPSPQASQSPAEVPTSPPSTLDQKSPDSPISPDRESLKAEQVISTLDRDISAVCHRFTSTAVSRTSVRSISAPCSPSPNLVIPSQSSLSQPAWPIQTDLSQPVSHLYPVSQPLDLRIPEFNIDSSSKEHAESHKLQLSPDHETQTLEKSPASCSPSLDLSTIPSQDTELLEQPVQSSTSASLAHKLVLPAPESLSTSVEHSSLSLSPCADQIGDSPKPLSPFQNPSAVEGSPQHSNSSSRSAIPLNVTEMPTSQGTPMETGLVCASPLPADISATDNVLSQLEEMEIDAENIEPEASPAHIKSSPSSPFESIHSSPVQAKSPLVSSVEEPTETNHAHPEQLSSIQVPSTPISPVLTPASFSPPHCKPSEDSPDDGPPSHSAAEVIHSPPRSSPAGHTSPVYIHSTSSCADSGAIQRPSLHGSPAHATEIGSPLHSSTQASETYPGTIDGTNMASETEAILGLKTEQPSPISPCIIDVADSEVDSGLDKATLEAVQTNCPSSPSSLPDASTPVSPSHAKAASTHLSPERSGTASPSTQRPSTPYDATSTHPSPSPTSPQPSSPAQDNTAMPSTSFTPASPTSTSILPVSPAQNIPVDASKAKASPIASLVSSPSHQRSRPTSPMQPEVIPSPLPSRSEASSGPASPFESEAITGPGLDFDSVKTEINTGTGLPVSEEHLPVSRTDSPQQEMEVQEETHSSLNICLVVEAEKMEVDEQIHEEPMETELQKTSDLGQAEVLDENLQKTEESVEQEQPVEITEPRKNQEVQDLSLNSPSGAQLTSVPIEDQHSPPHSASASPLRSQPASSSPKTTSPNSALSPRPSSPPLPNPQSSSRAGSLDASPCISSPQIQTEQPEDRETVDIEPTDKNAESTIEEIESTNHIEASTNQEIESVNEKELLSEEVELTNQQEECQEFESTNEKYDISSQEEDLLLKGTDSEDGSSCSTFDNQNTVENIAAVNESTNESQVGLLEKRAEAQKTEAEQEEAELAEKVEVQMSERTDESEIDYLEMEPEVIQAEEVVQIQDDIVEKPKTPEEEQEELEWCKTAQTEDRSQIVTLEEETKIIERVGSPETREKIVENLEICGKREEEELSIEEVWPTKVIGGELKKVEDLKIVEENNEESQCLEECVVKERPEIIKAQDKMSEKTSKEEKEVMEELEEQTEERNGQSEDVEEECTIEQRAEICEMQEKMSERPKTLEENMEIGDQSEVMSFKKENIFGDGVELQDKTLEKVKMQGEKEEALMAEWEETLEKTVENVEQLEVEKTEILDNKITENAETPETTEVSLTTKDKEIKSVEMDEESRVKTPEREDEDDQESDIEDAVSPVLELDPSLDMEVMELMSSASPPPSLLTLSSPSSPTMHFQRRGKGRTFRTLQCSSRPEDDLSIRLRQSPFSTEASPETSPNRVPITPPPLSPLTPPLRASPSPRESPPLSRPLVPSTTVIPLTPKIGMGKPAITKRKFSPGRARSRQCSWWSSRRAVSPPSSSQDSGDGEWDSPKPRSQDSPLWNMKMGRGTGFPGRRRSRGGGLGGGRGGRGRSRLKTQDSLTVSPGGGYMETFQTRDEEDNSMHNTVVMFSTTDHFTLKQDMCVVCGSFGQGQEGRLLACAQCGQCYHPYCVNVKITRVILTKGWRCLECTVCEACGEASDPGRLLLCDDCDISYHTYCLDPPLHTVPKGAWKCKWCVWCVQCGSTSPGLHCDWQNNYSLCGPCSSLSRCPLCQRPYSHDDLILQCQQCDRWVHAVCHGLMSEDEVETTADEGFDCTLCKNHGRGSFVRSDSFESPYMAQIISRFREPDLKTYTQDGVCLTESGLSHLQSLVEPLTSPRRYRRNKPKLKLRIINQNSVSVLQTPEPETPTEPEPCRVDLECEMKSDSSPERDQPHEEDIIKEPEKTNDGKKRKRKPYRPGIGGFMVRQRGGKAGPSRIKLCRNDSLDMNPGRDDDGDHAMDTSTDRTVEKVKKRYRKKKTKLEETFPSYLQEAFFGRDLLDRSRLIDRRAGPEAPAPSQSGHSPGLIKVPVPGFHSHAPQRQGSLPISEEVLMDLSDVLNTNPHILATGQTGQFQVERSLSPFAGLDISSMHDSGPGRNQRAVQEEPLDAILSPELDKMVTDGAILSKLYKIPELEGKDVEEVFTAVMSPNSNNSSSSQSEPSLQTHSSGNKTHPHILGAPFPRLPLMNGLMGSSSHFPNTSIMQRGAQSLPGFRMPPPSGPTSSMPGPAPSMQASNQAPAAAAAPESEQDALSTAQRGMLKWEKEEPLGELATVAPVLYCNVKFPQLREQYPDWEARKKQISKLWRKASSQDRAPFVQKARDNRAAQRINKVQLPNDPTKRHAPPPPPQQLPGPYDPVSMESDLGFKDPLRPKESEQEQEWKMRQGEVNDRWAAGLKSPSHKDCPYQASVAGAGKEALQMRQKSKQLAKIEATQKLEQVKNEQLLQQRQQQQQFLSNQRLCGGVSPETGSRSPMTPSQLQPVAGSNASGLADDVFLRPQAPPPSGFSPSSPQMFSPPSSRPSSPWDPYGKVVGTPRPQSGPPPQQQQRRNSLSASPAHDALGSPAPSPDAKTTDVNRSMAPQPGLQQGRPGMMSPSSSSSEHQSRLSGFRPELYQRPVFKAPMPPHQQDAFGMPRRDPSRPTDLGFPLAPSQDSSSFPSSPLSGLGSPHRSPYSQAPGTPRSDYGQQMPDPFSHQSPRPSPDPHSNPQTPGTPRFPRSPVGTPRPSPEAFNQPTGDGFSAPSGASGLSPRAPGLSTEAAGFSTPHHQLQHSPGRPQPQQQHQDSFPRTPGGQTPKHPGMSEDGGFTAQTPGHDPFEQSHMTPGPQSHKTPVANEMSALGVDGPISIMPQIGDSEDKLRQRQRLRQLILRQQQQKSFLRQEKGLQEAAAAGHAPSQAPPTTCHAPVQAPSTTVGHTPSQPTLLHWSQEEPDAFGRPPPPYPGTIKPVGPPHQGPSHQGLPLQGPPHQGLALQVPQRFPPGFHGDQQQLRGFAPHQAGAFPRQMIVRGPPIRFSVPPGAPGLQDSFMRPAQGPLPGPGQAAPAGVPVPMRRPMPGDLTGIRPIPGPNAPPHMLQGVPGQFVPRSVPLQPHAAHSIMGQPYIELRHRAPENRLRMPFSVGTAMEQEVHPSRQQLGMGPNVDLSGADGMEEHLEGEDSAVKDLEDVEVKDLVDLNLNLDPEDGKEDLDLAANDLHLDDFLLSGKFDLIAYADPELNLDNEDLDLDPVDQDRDRKSEGHHGQSAVLNQIKQEVKTEGREKSVAQNQAPPPGLVSAARPLPPGAITVATGHALNKEKVEGSVSSGQTQNQALSMATAPVFQQQPRPFGPSSLAPPQTLQPRLVLNPPAPQAQLQAQLLAQLQAQADGQARPLLLEEQPLLLQDLLDQERQEQQQQKQMQALIRQRSTTEPPPPVFPNLDLDSISDPIMKAKMVALKGINKFMAQGPLALNPMVRFQQQQPPPGPSPAPEGSAPQPPLLPPQDGKLNPQMVRPTPPNLGPGFVNEAQRRQYEEWLGETQQLLQMQQRLLEDQIAAHRKTKKALSAKQRTAKKAGRPFAEEDAVQLRFVTEQQGTVQKQLEQIRKQQKDHAELIEDYQTKHQQRPLQTPSGPPLMPPMATALMPQQVAPMQPPPRVPSVGPGASLAWTPAGGVAPGAMPQRMPAHMPPQMAPALTPTPQPPAQGPGFISGPNGAADAPAPQVKFDDNNPFSEGFQERERRERLREQQERQRVQLMHEVERHRAMQQRLELEQQQGLMGAGPRGVPPSTQGGPSAPPPTPSGESLSQMPFFSSELPQDFLQSPPSRPPAPHQQQGGAPFAQQQALHPGFSGGQLHPHQMELQTRQRHPAPAAAPAQSQCITAGMGSAGMPPSHPGAQRFGHDSSSSSPSTPRPPSSGHTHLSSGPASMLQLYSDILPDEQTKKNRNKKRDGEAGDRTPLSSHSDDITAPPTPAISETACSTPTRAGADQSELFSLAPSSELERQLSVSAAAQERGTVLGIEAQRGPLSVVRLEVKEERVEGRACAGVKLEDSEALGSGDSGKELLRHLLKEKSPSATTTPPLPPHPPHGGAHRQMSIDSVRSEDEDGFHNNTVRLESPGVDFLDKKGARCKRLSKPEKDRPQTKYKRRKKEDEDEKMLHSNNTSGSSDSIMTHLRQLSVLPLMEPVLRVDLTLFPPYGSSSLGSDSRLTGSFGNACLDGVTDYYSQLIYKQNNLSNPPTPPASLPPTPPPATRQKLVNGFATTEELSRKDITEQEVKAVSGLKQKGEALLSINHASKTVDVPASLPTPPHNNQEDVRGQFMSERMSPDGFVPSSSPESVADAEISRFPDLSFIKLEPPSPCPSPPIPIMPCAWGKGSALKQEVKSEPNHQAPPSCSNTDLVTIAITLNPVAAQNVPGVVAAVAQLLRLPVPVDYQLNRAVGPERSNLALLAGVRVPMMQGAAGLRAQRPPTPANIAVRLDLNQQQPVRPQGYCCFCKVPLGNGVRIIKEFKQEGQSRPGSSLVFCSPTCSAQFSADSQNAAANKVTSPVSSKTQHHYTNHMSSIAVHTLPLRPPSSGPAHSPPLAFPPAAAIALEARPCTDSLKVKVKLKPRPRAVPGGEESHHGKRPKSSRWRRWSVSITLSRGPCVPNESGAVPTEEELQTLGACLRPDPLPKDQRRCCFCHQLGDGLTDGPARLLNLDLDLWVHLNCALWSSEVYETQAGALINVELALRRGLTLRCAHCQQTGATSGCNRLRCTNTYHFTCALQAHCTFFKDKTMLCHLHKPRSMSLSPSSVSTFDPMLPCDPYDSELRCFAVYRRVYVQRDEARQIAAAVQRGERQHTFRVGSLLFRAIGRLLPGQLHAFHSTAAIFPVGYHANRIYWSMRHQHRRCKYLCSIEEKDAQPLFKIKVVEKGYNDLILTGPSPKAVWEQVLEPVAELRTSCGALKLFPIYLKGEDLFGLTTSAVTRIIESLPGVEACERYSFRFGKNPLMEWPLAFNPSGSARSEPKVSQAKRPFLLTSVASRCQGSVGSIVGLVPGVISLSPGETVAGAHQGRHSKSAQYRRMKAEWKTNVYLARSRIQGLGLYAARDIEKCTMVIEYIGTIIRSEVANRKERLYEAQNRGVYMFRIDNDFVIDATITGGPARYINHSCAPNCITEVVTVEKENKIIISSCRRIQRGEELSYDYKFDFEDDQHKIPCHCGAVNCRKWMN